MPGRCAECGTADTPCWREGPSGARTLCNACGIRWKRHSGVSSRTSSSSRAHSPVAVIPILQTRTRQRGTRSPPKADDDDLYSPRKAVCKPKRARNRSLTNRSPITSPRISPTISAAIHEDKRQAVIEQLTRRVRVLEQEQKRTKYHFALLCRHLQSQPFADEEGRSFLEEILQLDSTPYDSENLNTVVEDRIEHMMGGDGEDEAWMLACIRAPDYLSSSPMRDLDIME